MRLSEYTDYTLRVLMSCAAQPQQLLTVAELAAQHGLSRHHVMKIVSDLAREGLVETTRGRGGGLRLSKRPHDVRIGDVLRFTETDFRMAECFDPGTNTCVLRPSCRLRQALGSALKAWFAELDRLTLADILLPQAAVARLAAAAPVAVVPRTRRPEDAAPKRRQATGGAAKLPRRPATAAPPRRKTVA